MPVILAAVVVLVLWHTPPTADLVMVYQSARPACVRPVLTNDTPWCFRAPRGCRQGLVGVQAFDTSEFLSGPVEIEHRVLRSGDVLYISAVPVKNCWEYPYVRLEVRHDG